MREELTQAELDEHFYGKKPVVHATFYMEQVVDIEASNEAGKQVMKESLYVHLHCPKEGQEIRRPANGSDLAEFAAQYAAFQEKQDGQVQDIRPQVSDGRAERLG